LGVLIIIEDMKFTEEKLEKAFTELLGQEGNKISNQK